MNLSLLDSIIASRNGILATVASTEGHTYKKAGEKALFEVDATTPTHGNLGSRCSEQDIIENGKEVFEGGRPKHVTIDARNESDIHFGYGTYCGGSMKVLIEPIKDNHKNVYRQIRERLTAGRPCSLVHDLETGDIRLDAVSGQLAESEFIEQIPSLTPLILFGATPLARTIAHHVEEMNFLLTVVDWREHYLNTFRKLGYATLLDTDHTPNKNAMILILSHSFERDLTALDNALSSDCRYIGLLSSRTRRDKMYDILSAQGVARASIERVHSPVGIDIRSKSDPEIAVSIVAELVRCKND